MSAQPAIERILLATDFGANLYVGQMHARLHALVPGVPCMSLMQDLPPFRPDLAAYLLPALLRDLPRDSLLLCVVDPGVGGERAGLLVRADGHWLIGPDNGLFALVARRAGDGAVWRIGWQPERMSASFHGRDWFAPAAARLVLGEDLELMPLAPADLIGADWPDERATIVYVDHFGNLMTGMRASSVVAEAVLRVRGQPLPRARTFCEVEPGQAFWYENALGLIEIAVNQGRADRQLALGVGDSVEFG
ncbi:SAM-dependent chlorinase/fluorinase [Allochromatium humboldtianum]|uniref:SAM-dependent chlorinase/fluorinase n=1 Tax=Allochromatium humboldtianum TaxID=504901 RepID=A0A850REP9_9GAMM|nr:SAM-dependent chlorinase/fluorinase [Allochromatium humboldtianum]NVZ11465.1 SAM-dependent chlorinase/fluorinase [Allochromatium humboldtianum]